MKWKIYAGKGIDLECIILKYLSQNQRTKQDLLHMNILDTNSQCVSKCISDEYKNNFK